MQRPIAPLPTILRAALAGALTFACAAIAAPERSVANETAPPAGSGVDVWMPIEIGVQKTFVHREDTRFSAQGTDLGEERMVGTREEEVRAAPPEYTQAQAEVRVTTRLRGASGEQIDVERLFVTPTSSAYLVHAADIEMGGQRFTLRYPQPAVALVEGARPGQKWHVSTEEMAGLKADTWGEVVGLQDARTPAGLFEKCLVVRYTGTVEGVVDVPGAGPMEISNGKLVLTEWHARGLGMVLSKEEITQSLRAENGMTAEANVVSQSSLKEIRRSAPAAAAP